MMLTTVIDMTTTNDLKSTARGRRRQSSAEARTVVIVNGRSRMSELLEHAVDAGQYDVVFVESVGHAYSQIKKIQPDLVVISIHLDDLDAFGVLSMLKLDPETRRIPLLTYTSDESDDQNDTEEPEATDEEMLVPRSALRMN